MEKKIVHVKIIDASEEDVKSMASFMKQLKDQLPYEIEFLITNEKIEMQSIKHLIKELYTIYKLEKKLLEKKK